MEERAFRKTDFIEVPIKDFMAGAVLTVDLFIQLSDNKFIQIANAGARVSMDRLLAYEKKNVTHLLIKRAAYSKYIDEGLNVAGVIIKNKDIQLAQKQSALTKMASNVFTQIEQVGLNQENFEHAKVITNLAVALCTAKVDLFQLMAMFALHDTSLYAHSIAVSTISVMIGMGLNWKSVTIEKLGLGGLLHDIGKREMPVALVRKPRVLMNPKEVQEYESHCQRGLEILRSIQDIPDDVVAIANEHHELCNGKGFPRKIKLMYINPLARVVALADYFCNLTMKSTENNFPKTPLEAIQHIQKQAPHGYWADALEVLKTLAPAVKGKTSAA